jgi:hypothetical protein
MSWNSSETLMKSFYAEKIILQEVIENFVGILHWGMISINFSYRLSNPRLQSQESYNRNTLYSLEVK